MKHWTCCDVDLRVPILTEAPPRSILVLSGRHHFISNASIVNNCIIPYTDWKTVWTWLTCAIQKFLSEGTNSDTVFLNTAKSGLARDVDGPPLNAGLVVLWFQVLLRSPITLWFSGGGGEVWTPTPTHSGSAHDETTQINGCIRH